MKFLIAFALFAVAFADIEPYRLREAPAPAFERSDDHPYLVNVVDSPTPVDALESDAAPKTFNIVKVVDFVKGVFNTYGGVKATFEDAEDSYDRTVKFVDEAINEEQVDNENMLINVLDGLQYAALSDFAVKVVNEAVNDNASPVKEESLVEEVALSDIAVNFIDEAVNKITSDTETGPSFDAQEEKYIGSEDVVPTAVKVVENAVEESEDTLDVHAKAEAYDAVKVAEFPRGKVFDNPMLR